MDLSPIPVRPKRVPQPLFQDFRAAEWPSLPSPGDEAPQKVLEENQKAWDRVARLERGLHSLATVEGGGALARHVLLVAWRVTRGFAIVTKAITPHQGLADIRPARWTQTLDLDGVGPLALDPRAAPTSFARALGIALPSLHAQVGGPTHYVVQWLLESPETRPLLVWPEPQELVAFERMIMSSAQRILSNKGRMALARYFTDRLGLGHREAQELIAQTMQFYRALGAVDPDVERGILLERAERFYSRARAAGVLREEGNAIKLHAQLVGLTRESPAKEEEEVNLLEVIRAVNAVEGPPSKSIPAPPAA